jgi:hypothetical protein
MGSSRWIIAAAAGIALAALGAIALPFLREPAIPIQSANGDFEHDCCGKLRLRDGRMMLGDKLDIGYAIDRDAKGPFILPSVYSGPWEDNGFETDGSRPPLKLRLDKLPAPETIELYSGGKTYVFKRKRFVLPVAASAAAAAKHPSTH